MVWWDFGRLFWWFWWFEKWWKWRKIGVLSNSSPNSKRGFRRENIRYALFGNRTFVLKCKLCPIQAPKTYCNSTVLWYDFDCQVIMLYTCFCPVWAICQVKNLDMFSITLRVRLRWYQNDIKIISIRNNTVTITQYICNIILIYCNIIAIQT